MGGKPAVVSNLLLAVFTKIDINSYIQRITRNYFKRIIK